MRTLSRFVALFSFAAAISSAADFGTGLTAYQKGDYAAALKEWRPLADQGVAAAQFNLGLMYLDGHGVPQSAEEAVKWFERSAEQDYTQAQHNLGAMYATGQGVKRDYVQAYKWLNICAAKENAGCITQRDLIAKKLRKSQIAEAQRLSTSFTAKKEPDK